MSIRAALLLILVMLTGARSPGAGAHEYSKSGIMVAHPWSRATPGAARNGAMFCEIKSTADKADRLIAAKAEAAARVEIHNHIMDNGIARMRRVGSVTIPAGRSVLLAPHGFHIMLMDLTAPLKEGDFLSVTLVFEQAGEVTVAASIEPVGAMGPHGVNNQPGQAGGEHKH